MITFLILDTVLYGINYTRFMRKHIKILRQVISYTASNLMLKSKRISFDHGFHIDLGFGTINGIN